MAIARDKFWIMGVRAHQDDIWLGMHKEKRDYKWSRITPGEAALMLDVPNMLMVNCDGIPVPFSADAYGYMESFITLKKVLWGATGSDGFRCGNEEKFICKLAEKYPNICGAYADDLFSAYKDEERTEKVKPILDAIDAGLAKALRPMELFATWYTHQLKAVDPILLEKITGIALWTWHCEQLPLLEERFQYIEKNFPDKKLLLGIYMYDFPSGMPVPDELMEHQCELGLRLLKEGRIDGMVFEANSVMGVGLPSEKWLREWIKKVKYTEVPD